MAEPRRSGRERKANPKYANDGWDKDILRKLRESSESSGSSPVDHSSEPDDIPILDDVGNPVRDDDDISMVSAASSRSSDVQTPNKEDESQSMSSDDDTTKNNSERRHFTITNSETSRSRGIPFQRGRGAAAAYSGLLGSEVDDLSDVLQARDTWLKGCDITIPSRQTLSAAIAQPESLSEECGKDDDSVQPEPRDPSSPSPSIYTNQVMKQITTSETYARHLLGHKPSHSVVLGPLGTQKKYVINYLSNLDFGRAWPKTENLREEAKPSNENRYHEGWLLNVGEKVQSLAWAPGPGPVQYLAVAFKCSSQQRQLTRAADHQHSAFSPSPPYPSAIQIWAFCTDNANSEGLRTLNMKQPPRLAMVLATECGNIRHLKWSPLMPTVGNRDAASSSVMGFLGIVSSDGHARIIVVPVTSDIEEPEPTMLFVERSGLDITPPKDTIFTTLSFAGPTDLLLGTAGGCVHVYDLCEHQDREGVPKTYLQQQVHHTYVVSLCTAIPGPHSTLIASAPASGDLVLTDLRSPEQDRVSVPRTCFPNRDLVYMPFTRSFVTLLDRSGKGQVERNVDSLLVCHHIRQFPNMLKLAKLPHESGAATALAGSKWHPCILVGNTKGEVFATNYLRKVLPDRKTDQKKAVGAYIQKVCEYEWRPLTQVEMSKDDLPGKETGDKESVDLFYGRDVAPGLSRFHEGFEPEKNEVGKFHPSGRKVRKKQDEEISGKAVFEEEQAVTAIEWNPNSASAGIVAVGWGSGIVRVQDLAYDSGEK